MGERCGSLNLRGSQMKRILINATHKEELRVAVIDGHHLFDIHTEVPAKEQKKGNVYKGKITRVESSLEAVFVEYSSERQGFLPFKEISRDYFSKAPSGRSDSAKAQDLLKVGQEVIVQIVKEGRGNKGAALTTFISLAGRYLVLMPNSPRAGGISRHIDGDERTELQAVISELSVPERMGMIVRTAGAGKQLEELKWDLDYLVQLWAEIDKAAQGRTAPFLVYQESNIVIRTLRDYLREDISEILIDSPFVYQTGYDFMRMVMPRELNKLKLYQGTIPLFTRYRIESQIESVLSHKVHLPSGGALVIDLTEALTSIDVNSAKANKGSDIEETAFNTNLEATAEIARQLRLRDLGGLIVVDFIDMASSRHQRDVENQLRDHFKADSARVQIGRISKFGLLEMSRQRLRPLLGDSHQEVCPRCSGLGHVRSVESLGLAMLRLFEEDAARETVAKLVVQLPASVATFLLNEKRGQLDTIERNYGIKLLVVPNPNIETPRYDIKRIQGVGQTVVSYNIDLVSEAEMLPTVQQQPILEKPAITGISPADPAPKPANKNKLGLLKRLWAIFSGQNHNRVADSAKTEKTVASKPRSSQNRRPRNRNNNRRGPRQRRDQGNITQTKQSAAAISVTEKRKHEAAGGDSNFKQGSSLNVPHSRRADLR